MHVLVTGGCGDIGSGLVRQLQADENVARIAVLDSLDTGSPWNLFGSCVSEDFSFRRGDESNRRPFIHVRDAARAYKSAACDPDADPDITYQEDERPGPSYHVDFGRLEETGFGTGWTLREGVREMVENFTDDSRRVSA